MTGRSDIEERLLDEALTWQHALESDDADWDGYMLWLEADPRHREAFDVIALVDTAVNENKAEIGSLLAVQDAPAPLRANGGTRLWLLGGGMAAAIALVIGLPMLWPKLWRADPVSTYRSDMGQSRSLALANGTNVTLSPSSAIVVTGKDAARIELASGEAYFEVTHDPRRSVTVTANGYRITDIGTRFAVNTAGDSFRVGVSQGAVSVSSPQSDHEAQITAGHQFVAVADIATVSRVAASDVGSWRNGRLSYSDAPLSLVAADISRYLGKSVMVDPSLEKSHFSGTLVIGDGSRLLSDLATVMSIDVRPEKGGFRIGATDRSR